MVLLTIINVTGRNIGKDAIPSSRIEEQKLKYDLKRIEECKENKFKYMKGNSRIEFPFCF